MQAWLLSSLRQKLDRWIEAPRCGAPDQRHGRGQGEIRHVQYPQLVAMRAVFELAPGHQTQAAALGEQRQLKVFTKNFRRDVERELQPVERLHQRGAASASRRIEKPVLVGEIAQPPRLSGRPSPAVLPMRPR